MLIAILPGKLFLRNCLFECVYFMLKLCHSGIALEKNISVVTHPLLKAHFLRIGVVVEL